MNKQYFTYLLKNRKHLMISLTMIELIVILALRMSIRTPIMPNTRTLQSLSIVLMGFAGTLSIVLPILLLGFVNNRSASDKIFSLPISRKEILFTTEVFTAGFIFLVYTVLEILLTVSLLPYLKYLNMGTYLLHYVVMLIGIVVVSLFSSMIYLLANNTVDGVIFLGGYYLIPFLIYLNASYFDSSYVAGFHYLSDQIGGNLSFPWVFAVTAGGLVENSNIFGSFVNLSSFLINAGIHLLAAGYGLKKLFVERASETAGQISNRKMGYPFLFAVYLLGTTILVTVATCGLREGLSTLLVTYAMIFVFYLIFSFIYRRAVRIHAKDILLFAAAILFANGLNGIASLTKGFGLSQKYTHNVPVLNYEYRAFQTDSELERLIPGKAFDDVQVSFEVLVEEGKDSEALRSMLESMRSQAIDDFYTRRESPQDAWLGVYDNYQTKKGFDSVPSYDRMYSYQLKEILSLEELKEVNRYTEVTVYWWEDDMYHELTLDQLLEQK